MTPHAHIFVGRKTELEQFASIIKPLSRDTYPAMVTPPPIKPRVFLPFGIGGIGKTELSRRCAEIAGEDGWQIITIDWENVEHRPVEPMQLMNSIANALKAVAGEKIIKPYLDDQQNIANVNGKVNRYRVDHPAEWQKALEVARGLKDVLPDPVTKSLAAGAAFTMDVGPKILAGLADELAARKVLKNAREAAVFKSPEVELAHHLVKAIIDTARNEPLLIVFDTCEWLSLSLEEFLRDLIVCPAAEQGGNLIFIVSGRFSQYREREVEDNNGNRKRIKGYADRLADPPPVVWDLSAFADPEVAGYLRACELESTPELIGFIQHLARGVPFAVQLVTEALLKLGSERVKQDFPPKDAEDFDAQEMVTQVVRRFLRYCLDNAADEDRLRTLALLRTRDDAALRAIWNLKPEEKPRHVLADLEARYSFVRSDGSLHDVVREFLRDSLRGDDRETARLLGQMAATHYRPRWESETADLPILADRLVEERWRGLTQDVLNALCWCSEIDAVRFLAGRAIEALEFNWAFAKGLIKLAREFRDASGWWATRSKRRFDALQRAIEGQDHDEMTGLEALLHDRVELNLDITQCCLLQMWRAGNLLDQKQIQVALKACLEAEKYSSADESVRLTLADMFGSIGNAVGFQRGVAVYSEEGRTAYEHAVALAPNEASYHGNLGAMLFTSRDPNRLQLALACCSRAIKLDPNLAPAYSIRGNTYADLGDYSAALADYTCALELDPSDAVTYFNRGITYCALKDNPAALADYTRAIELDPDDADAYINRGNMYDALEDYQKALADYTRALDLAPNDAQAYNNRGNTYATLKNYDAALADYTSALDLDPDFTAAYRDRGSAHYQQRNYKAALVDFNRALELDPDNAEVLTIRGEAYAYCGEYQIALSDFAQAMKLNPEYTNSAYDVACTYALQNDVAEACSWLRKAVALSKEWFTRAQTDSDFDAIRDTPEFQSLMQDFAPKA